MVVFRNRVVSSAVTADDAVTAFCTTSLAYKERSVNLFGLFLVIVVIIVELAGFPVLFAVVVVVDVFVVVVVIVVVVSVAVEEVLLAEWG